MLAVVLVGAAVWIAMLRGEPVGTLTCRLYSAFGPRSANITVRRAAGSREPAIKLQVRVSAGLNSVSLDPVQARQLADILDAAASRAHRP
jgi:hypothetical protein